MNLPTSSVTETLDNLVAAAKQADKVSLEQLTQAFGRRGYGPFLMLPALIEISPIGGVPGVPSFLAFVILLFAVQMLLGRRTLYLPAWIGRRRLSSKALRSGAERMRPVATRLDRWFYGRLPRLTGEPFIRFAALVCILLAITVPPLEIVPFASSAPMAAIAAFGLSILVRDGALMLGAVLLSLLTLVVGAGIWA